MQKFARTAAVAAALLLLLAPTVFGSGVEDAAADERMVITWAGPYGPVGEMGETGEGDSWATMMFEERFNVDIQANGIGSNEGEKVQIMLASGEFPDTGALWGRGIDHYNDGIIRPIPIAMIREFMPAYTQRMDSEYPDGWLRDLNPDNPEEEVLGIQGFSAQNVSMGYFIAFRTDWAAKVGATLSDYESTKYSIDEYGRVYYWPNPDGSATLDWFEDLLIRFRDGDPDGNGQNDTIPFGGGGGPRYGWLHSPIAGAFQAQLEGRRNTLVDGRLYTEEISPNYRKYLQLMAKWYETGLLDKEFLTIDRAKAWDKVQAGLTASQSIHYWYSGREDRMHLPPNSFVPEEDLGKAEVPLFQPVGPDGYRGGGAYNPSPWYNMNQYVNADVDDEKLKVILQIVDAAYYGTAEDWVHQRFGKEGVHFDWSGEPWNSTPVRRAEEDIAPTAGEPTVGPFVNSYPPSASADRIVFNNAPMITTFLTEHIVSPAGMARTLLPYRFDSKSETNLAELYSEHGEVLSTLTTEFSAKAIVGEVDINDDAEWDSYVADYLKFGGAEILDELLKAPVYEKFRNGVTEYAAGPDEMWW